MITRTNDIQDIGKRVRRARRKAGMSQTQLAERVGYSAANPISKLESGHVSSVDVIMLQRIAASTGVTLAHLLEDSGLPEAGPSNFPAVGAPDAIVLDWHDVVRTIQRMSTVLQELVQRVTRLEERMFSGGARPRGEPDAPAQG